MWNDPQLGIRDTARVISSARRRNFQGKAGRSLDHDNRDGRPFATVVDVHSAGSRAAILRCP